MLPTRTTRISLAEDLAAAQRRRMILLKNSTIIRSDLVEDKIFKSTLKKQMLTIPYGLPKELMLLPKRLTRRKRQRIQEANLSASNQLIKRRNNLLALKAEDCSIR